VPVNLPAEAPEASLRALRAAGIHRVIGVADPWKQLGIDSPADCGVQALPVELDAASLARDRRWTVLRWCAARLLPVPLSARLLLRGELDDAGARAVVLFTRGATGTRKSVVLSHRNVLSNLLALCEVFDVGPEDGILCAAPFWHSFGFVGGLCLPMFAGARAAYHEDAFDVAGVAEAARHFAASLLLATPAALELYAAHVDPAAFASLERAVTGGAPLSAAVSERFRARFGVEPLEGYGCAECSPLISLNVPDFVEPGGSTQIGTRRGTLGHPLPGVAVRIVDAATRAVLPPETPGCIEVRGPNVLRGYLRDDGSESAPTDAEGWFDTGDLGSLDRAGFLTVIGRADSRPSPGTANAS
jgi:acyl-[acyl-carrier-protein]-phospholipid O-acyltransferase/long-chain-fatty-acid--[acyl-carrier-protein] ligase